MTIQQHYYTSYRNPSTGRGGFQVKAMSPNIDPSHQAQLLRLLAYRLPAGAQASAIDEHPVALRYYYQDEESSFLIHSQSSGGDDNGRPGNFFAHSLVMPTELFSNIPPIFFWRSPFWQTQDSTNNDELAVLSDLDLEPALDTDQVWSLLQSEQNRQYLGALISAVIHLESSRRNIILIADSQQIALWIAAVSCMLPPTWRPLLTFSTYQHDPYQSPFMLTGAPPVTLFQPGANDYRNYFILNLTTGEVSQSVSSPYADFITTIADEEHYEDRLLPLFEAHANTLHRIRRISPQVDHIVK